MDAPVRVGLIVDENAYFRMAVGSILERQFGCSPVIEAKSFDEGLERLGGQSNIAVALFDLAVPGMRTPTNLRTIRECFPGTRVAVTSVSANRRNILLALEAGVHGYLEKSLGITELTSALKIIFDGGIYVPPSLADISSSSHEEGDKELQRATIEKTGASGSDRENVVPVSPLTPRQQDVLDLLVQGKTNKEIAQSLGLGEGTVKIHMAAIFRYFGVTNRAAAAVAGARPYPNRKRDLMSDT